MQVWAGATECLPFSFPVIKILASDTFMNSTYCIVRIIIIQCRYNYVHGANGIYNDKYTFISRLNLVNDTRTKYEYSLHNLLYN